MREDGQDGHPSECTMSCLLTIFALPAALIQAITKRLETHADICLSTELQLTSLISVCGDGRRRECRWGRAIEGGTPRLSERKMIKPWEELTWTIRDRSYHWVWSFFFPPLKAKKREKSLSHNLLPPHTHTHTLYLELYLPCRRMLVFILICLWPNKCRIAILCASPVWRWISSSLAILFLWGPGTKQHLHPGDSLG